MFKDTRRRFKQQLLQGVGAYEATDDSSFRDELRDYKNTCFAIKSLRKSMNKHLECVRKMHESSAALTVELAAFHQATEAAQSTVSLGQAMAETERVQLASVERLYEEEVKAATELLLWRTPEVEEKVKERKKQLLDYDAHLRRYENLSRSEIGELGGHDSSFDDGSSAEDLSSKRRSRMSNMSGFNKSKKGKTLFRKKRNEESTAEELASRKVKLEDSEEAVDTSTTWLMEQFHDLADKREAGTVLEGPMSALLACHLHLMQKSQERLEKLLPEFGSVELFLKTLERYDEEPPMKQQTIDVAGVAHMANMGRLSVTGWIKNKRNSTGEAGLENQKQIQARVLESGTPVVVCDCVAWIRAQGLETEGVFRIPGTQDKVDDILARYDLGEKGVISSVQDVSVHDVCTLLKQWLRELRDPIIPAMNYKPLMDLLRKDLNLEKGSTVTSVLQMVSTIPTENQHVLAMIAVLLHEVVKNEKLNQMSVSNLAICLAPSMLRAPADLEAGDVIADIQSAISACKVFILHAHKLEQPKQKHILANTFVELPGHTSSGKEKNFATAV